MRITNDMRKSILNSEVLTKFNKEVLALDKALMLSIEKIVKDKTKGVSSKMIASGYVHVTSSFSLVGGDNYQRKAIGLPGYLYNTYPRKSGEYSHKIKPNKEVLTNIKASKKIRVARDEFRKDLRQVLYSYTTDKKLLAVVPELKEYFKDSQKAQSMSLVPVEQINKVRKSLKRKIVGAKK